MQNLALYQELLELDLFHYGVAKFSREEFQEVGMSDDDVFLLQYMADQEVGHATAIANMLGRKCRNLMIAWASLTDPLQSQQCIEVMRILLPGTDGQGVPPIQ